MVCLTDLFLHTGLTDFTIQGLTDLFMIINTFNEYGLTLTADALAAISNDKRSCSLKFIDSIANILFKKDLNFIDSDQIYAALSLNATLDTPLFSLIQSNSCSLGSSLFKIASVKDRFDYIKARLLRNPLYSNRTFLNQPQPIITPIKNLIGNSGSFLLFGMLTLMQQGKFHLEDPDSFVEIQFSPETKKSIGYFTFNCMVLVQGQYSDNLIFTVDKISMPPADIAPSVSKTDLFTGSDHPKDVLNLVKLNNLDVSIIIVSDVWLDKPQTFKRLDLMFQGFNDNPPLAFILMGNFISIPYNMDGSEQVNYTESFNHFADLLSNYKNLVDCHFVFIPGPNDPWGNNLLPQQAIPNQFTLKVRVKLPNSTFSINPARIRYCDQDYVFFRDDLKNRTSRNCIISPDLSIASETDHFIQTILLQSHLVSLPCSIRPVFWEFEHLLRLTPTPSMLVLGDSSEMFDSVFDDCLVCNPGNFAVDGRFYYYKPMTRSIEQCEIPLV